MKGKSPARSHETSRSGVDLLSRFYSGAPVTAEAYLPDTERITGRGTRHDVGLGECRGNFASAAADG